MPESRDQNLHVQAADSPGWRQNTPREKQRAALTICDLAGTADDALPALAALGLVDPLTPLPDAPVGPNLRKHVDAARHGTRSGLDWHQTTRVPICAQCRAWGENNAMGAH